MSHQLEEIIGYHFHNPLLLETALTHTSYANESRTPVKHNERLEFLGDSVLRSFQRIICSTPTPTGRKAI